MLVREVAAPVGMRLRGRTLAAAPVGLPHGGLTAKTATLPPPAPLRRRVRPPRAAATGFDAAAAAAITVAEAAAPAALASTLGSDGGPVTGCITDGAGGPVKTGGAQKHSAQPPAQ
jgi:hypothetical protein